MKRLRYICYKNTYSIYCMFLCLHKYFSNIYTCWGSISFTGHPLLTNSRINFLTLDIYKRSHFALPFARRAGKWRHLRDSRRVQRSHLWEPKGSAVSGKPEGMRSRVECRAVSEGVLKMRNHGPIRSMLKMRPSVVVVRTFQCPHLKEQDEENFKGMKENPNHPTQPRRLT
jgi:hypothetical protein